MLDDLIGTVEVPSDWFDMTFGPHRYTLTDVPSDATQAIVQELKAQGVPITAENIINAWLLGKKEGIFDE